eukprot:1008362-Pelagomonas_calceolata.AAC.5
MPGIHRSQGGDDQPGQWASAEGSVPIDAGDSRGPPQNLSARQSPELSSATQQGQQMQAGRVEAEKEDVLQVCALACVCTRACRCGWGGTQYSRGSEAAQPVCDTVGPLL